VMADLFVHHATTDPEAVVSTSIVAPARVLAVARM
jgi:hypothetical protein